MIDLFEPRPLIRPSLLRWSFGAQAGHLLPQGRRWPAEDQC